MKNIKPPKVSVCLVTYNQEQYIRQCLQSVIDQEVDFEVEIIVSDDCSTDSTPQIIQEFAEKYKSIIPVLRQENIGAFRNFVETHDLATGEYVCHLDGDDYWLQGKVRAQARYLDNNINCNICYTRGYIRNSRTGEMKEDRFNFKNKSIFTRSDILRNISIGLHSSKMYRRHCRDYSYPPIEITDFFEEQNTAERRNFSKILFKMNEEEFDKHLEYKNWYETK